MPVGHLLRMQQEETWRAVDTYIEGVIGASDEVLEATLAESGRAGLPAISVSPAQGKLLHLLARAMGARRVLEVGDAWWLQHDLARACRRARGAGGDA